MVVWVMVIYCIYILVAHISRKGVNQYHVVYYCTYDKILLTVNTVPHDIAFAHGFNHYCVVDILAMSSVLKRGMSCFISLVDRILNRYPTFTYRVI